MNVKICTDIEQSKKLIELGLDANTADMDYILIANIEGEYSLCVNNRNNEHEIDDGWIPAWSLSALLDLMPSIDEFEPRIEKSLLDADKHNPYGCIYSDGSYAWHFYYADNPLDAAFEMVVWLIKNRKI